jgi:hypothetical protein
VIPHEVAHAYGQYFAIREQRFERPVGVQREVETARQRLIEATVSSAEF